MVTALDPSRLRPPSWDEHVDAETQLGGQLHGATDDHKDKLRLWLRLLTCTKLIEGEIRRRLHAEFGTTLPRFDLMAQKDRAE